MNQTVLLIEDNDQNGYLARYILEKQGFSVVHALNGQDGVAQATLLTPSLILLDIQLPMMDGYAVAQAIRGIAHLAQVPIIAVTSYAMVGDREKCLAAGCNGYIEKPINPETFVSEIRAFLPKQETST